MLIWAVWSDEEGRMACRNGLYYARPPDHCLYGTEKRAAGYLFPVFIIRFSIAYRFLFCENYMSVFFSFRSTKYSLYWSLLHWRSVFSQKCERVCSGVE